MTTTDQPFSQNHAVFEPRQRPGEPARFRALPGRTSSHGRYDSSLPNDSRWLEPGVAYQEMKQYNFEGFPGHPVLKSFVYDYYRRIEDSSVADKSAFESKSNPEVPVETATK